MEKVRLNKFVAENAEVSRRRADELIEKKRVRVNNKVVEKMPFFVDPESDVVKLNGEVVSVDKDKKNIHCTKQATRLRNNTKR